MKRLFAVLLFMLAAAPALAHYEVECTGSNDETDDEVTGTCTDGSFSGEDAQTGNSVSGSCYFDGSFDAEDDETGQTATGTCEGE